MKKTTKKKIFLTLKILLVLLVLLVAGIFIFRDQLLQTAIHRISDKISHDYDSNFSVKEAKFEGFSGVEMKDILLVPKNADTIFRIESLKTKVNFWKLLTADIQLGRLELKNGFVNLVKDSTGRNFDAFLKHDKKAEENISSEKRNYARLTYRILTRALNLVPTDMTLENLSLRMDDMGRKVRMDLGTLRLVNQQLETEILVQTNTFNQRWKIKGFADPRDKKADLRFFSIDSGKIRVPYIDERYNVKSGFDSIRVKVTNIDMDGDELHIDGSTSISNFFVNHPKIATKDVVIKKARYDYNMVFGPDFIKSDSTSVAYLNKIRFHPYAEYNIETDTTYQLKIDIPKMQAQDFITSLPEGLFRHFEGMEAEGSFDYHLDFKYNKNKPNALVFDSKLNKQNLKITKYGEADLAKLNTEFTYRAMDNGQRQRSILLSSRNPYFTRLDQISPYVRNAVLTSEDPSFFSHRGFINDAFKQSIVKNIKTKKFTRGASTISMQLVKNVFLTREKTLSRKLEEILLVYILENNRIASKSRMYEVYLNVIEWGPDIYGIGEASSFYFQKTPWELSLDESLFLASIVPKPKKFMWQFDTDGYLNASSVRKNNFIRNIMARRGLLSVGDTIGHGKIMILGPARNYMRSKPVNTIDADSISIEEFDF